MPRKPIKQSKDRKEKQGGLRYFISGVLIPAFLIALVGRIFLIQPFYIPSGSMHPTLVEGDQLLISKFAYGYSRYSIPFAPDLFDGRFLASQPERGDVVVFRRHVFNASEDWIKRTIGLPGDKIEVKGGRVILNDKPLATDLVGSYSYVDENNAKQTHQGTIYKETMPSGISYHVLDTGQSSADDFGPYVVPEGQVFLMGDNRDNSQDSRYIGPIPQDNLLGRALFIHFSYDWHTPAYAIWRWPVAIRFGRFFQDLYAD